MFIFSYRYDKKINLIYIEEVKAFFAVFRQLKPYGEPYNTSIPLMSRTIDRFMI